MLKIQPNFAVIVYPAHPYLGPWTWVDHLSSLLYFTREMSCKCQPLALVLLSHNFFPFPQLVSIHLCQLYMQNPIGWCVRFYICLSVSLIYEFIWQVQWLFNPCMIHKSKYKSLLVTFLTNIGWIEIKS